MTGAVDLVGILTDAAIKGADFGATTADPGKIAKVARDRVVELLGSGSGADRVKIFVDRPFDVGHTVTVKVTLPVQVDGYWYDVAAYRSAETQS